MADTPPCNDNAFHQPLQRLEDKNSLGRHIHRIIIKCRLRHENKAKAPSVNSLGEADRNIITAVLSNSSVIQLCQKYVSP